MTEGLAGVSSTQVQQIIDLLTSKTNTKLQGICDNNLLWIVDTGASNHVTNDLSILMNVRTIQNCPVGLPDGQFTNSNQIGSVELNGGLILDNVLFVPTLNCNLISVTQLSDESNCVIQFTNKICVIQDRLTRKMISLGERTDGLYFFSWNSVGQGVCG